MKTARSPIALDYRFFWTMLGGNFGGALLTVAYFRFLHPAALTHSSLFNAYELGYFVVAFAALVLLGRAVAGRWSRRLRAARGALPAGPESESLRRRALLVPAYLATVTFCGWVAAAVIWGIVWPLLTNTFTLAGAIRQCIGMIFVSGSVVTVYIFLATERIWRERIPQLFPDGKLSAAHAPRFEVRTRLVILFMLMTVLPMVVLSVATLARANALLLADVESPAIVIRNLIVIQVALAGTGLIVAMRLAHYVAGSVAQPVRQLVASMQQVQAGNLGIFCPVVSNDELGEASEGFNAMVAGLREREEMRETFGKYVSPQIRDEILSGRARNEGGLHDVSILFADLRGFTTWVEAADPSDVVTDLNAYFTEMDEAIREHGGVVLQFIGDEIEAVFGAPQANEYHADHAVAAALAMRARLQAWNAVRVADGKPAMHHGIGIHSGQVVAGNIGSASRMAYSLVGDVVNVASRIQALNRELGTTILASAVTCAKLTDSPAMERFPPLRVKGRVAEVDIFALC